jgi:hypothetical protein
MGSRFVFVLAVVLCCRAIETSAQQSTGPREAKAAEETVAHGIVRKPRPKPVEPAKAGQPARAVGPATPTPVSTEAVAAAIAKAVRSAEEAKKPVPAAAVAPRVVPQPAPRAPQRRYTVRWPIERFEVQWETPDERVRLSWNAGSSSTSARDGQGLEP